MTNPALQALAKMDDLAEEANADNLKFVVFSPANVSCWISEKGIIVWKDGAAGKRIRWQEALSRIAAHIRTQAA
jgi:hypothetical protein